MGYRLFLIKIDVDDIWLRFLGKKYFSISMENNFNEK